MIIVQSDAFNRSRLETVVAVLLTTNLRLLNAPGNVLIPAEASGLPKDSVANVSQLITLDRDFRLERAGQLRGQPMRDLEAVSDCCSAHRLRTADEDDRQACATEPDGVWSYKR